jgi:hypothetical protein
MYNEAKIAQRPGQPQGVAVQEAVAVPAQQIQR